MIALIEGQYYELTPIAPPDGPQTLIKAKDSTIWAYKGNKRVDYGVLFFSGSKSLHIHAKTGKYEGNLGQIRGIFHDSHVDLELSAT